MNKLKSIKLPRKLKKKYKKAGIIFLGSGYIMNETYELAGTLLPLKAKYITGVDVGDKDSYWVAI